MNQSNCYAFSLFILLTLLSSKVMSFDAGEHAIIGDVAYAKFESQFPNRIRNLEADISFSYGELIAMSADMYVSVEEISLNDPGFFNGFFHRNRKSLKTCIKKEIEAIKTKAKYSGCDDLDFAKKKLQYVALAHDNYKHFAWHNIKQYTELHNKALWFAQLAYLKCTPKQISQSLSDCEASQKLINELVASSEYRSKLKSKYRNFPKLFPRKRFTKKYLRELPKKKLIRLALFTNAFADHYLTDSFSAGHLRVPRSQIDQYVREQDKRRHFKSRQRGSSISGALTQYLHNLDGSVTGINVVNTAGQAFIVRSDKQLFSKLNSRELSGKVAENKQLTYPVQATQASLSELFAVISHGQKALPSGVFEALKYVPFVASPETDKLVERVEQHISEHGSIKKAIKSMSSEMQMVYRGSLAMDDISYQAYFQEFVVNLPTMMEALRKQINLEALDKELSNRIPKPLLDALKNLN